MTRQQIVEEVFTHVKTLVPGSAKNDVTPATRILSERVVDSLGIIQLVTFLESRFNIKMEQAELNFDNLDSAERMAEYVLRKRT